MPIEDGRQSATADRDPCFRRGEEDYVYLIFVWNSYLEITNARTRRYPGVE